MSAAVSYAITVLTTTQDDPSQLLARTATLLCKPGSSNRTAMQGDTVTNGWRISHTQRPTALAIVALATSHCGTRPGWAHLGAPSSSISQWLAGGAGGRLSKPWELAARNSHADPARLLLLPLDPAASESTLGIADAAAALLKPPQGSAAASSAPAVEVGVASSRVNSAFLGDDERRVAGAAEDDGVPASSRSDQREALVASAAVALAEAGIAARAPFLARSDTLTASGTAPPALLAVLQNPFHGAGGARAGLPEQLLWWAPGDLLTLVSTTRAAVESARKAARNAAGKGDEARQEAPVTPAEPGAAPLGRTSSGLPSGVAFSAVVDVLAAVLATAAEGPHVVAQQEVVSAGRQRAKARAASLGVDPVAIDKARRLASPGGSFAKAPAASVEGIDGGGKPARSHAADSEAFDPVSGWGHGRFHGRLRLRHQALAHAAATVRRPRASNGTVSLTVEGSAEDALSQLVKLQQQDRPGEEDTSALPGRAELGTPGSLGLWAVLVCDPLSGPCRDAAAEWNVLADAVAGPVHVDAAFAEPSSPVAAGSAGSGGAGKEAAAAGSGAPRPLAEGEAGMRALLAEAPEEVAYLRHWGVALAAVDATEPLAHPVLRALGVHSAPSVVALGCETEPSKARGLAVKLVNETRDLQALGNGMASAVGALRRAMPYKPELVGAGRANGRRELTAVGVARWLASVVRSEAVSHLLEEDVHTVMLTPEMHAAAKAYEDKLRRTAEEAAKAAREAEQEE